MPGSGAPSDCQPGSGIDVCQQRQLRTRRDKVRLRRRRAGTGTGVFCLRYGCGIHAGRPDRLDGQILSPSSAEAIAFRPCHIWTGGGRRREADRLAGSPVHRPFSIHARRCLHPPDAGHPWITDSRIQGMAAQSYVADPRRSISADRRHSPDCIDARPLDGHVGRHPPGRGFAGFHAGGSGDHCSCSPIRTRQYADKRYGRPDNAAQPADADAPDRIPSHIRKKPVVSCIRQEFAAPARPRHCHRESPHCDSRKPPC